ncbi:uncharacterized protein LACBIDRAFT_315120 [Laccaria bicolor S238N-H82]|uniref:Predicted protein n=1 Tax=Laccaria bicolor (strain S238N-H82 / ATCC MYA-4686) TaxID=486041 RepID=B0DZV7_LACBS|nr:uncharacterized protein LACBIDRAFT_315120 [Laccaria bicolor S238N-H82]EDQ99937.1 predicted protein [Laccaria bicolor S238N-H82]|eukprot:XP_001889480.1 predicted protein [Laccaria bicolor S238N-H82]
MTDCQTKVSAPRRVDPPAISLRPCCAQCRMHAFLPVAIYGKCSSRRLPLKLCFLKI